MKKKVVIIIFVIAIVILASTPIFIGFNYLDMFSKDEIQLMELPEVIPYEPEPTYITETAFDGSKELSPWLFAFPFKKTDFYVSNKELVKNVDEKQIEAVASRAKELVEVMYNVDSRSIRTEEKHRKKLGKVFCDSNLYYLGIAGEYEATDFISSMIAAISDADVSIESTFETDKCLVYEDGSYIVRGLLSIYCYKCNDSEHKLDQFYPVYFEKGQKYELIYEVGLVTGTASESREPEYMQISHTKVVKDISKKTI